VSRQEVALGQDSLNAAVDIRERRPHGGRPLLEADYPGRLIGHGVVVEQVPGQQDVERGQVPDAHGGDDSSIDVLLSGQVRGRILTAVP
jgi:hypothetical protein